MSNRITRGRNTVLAAEADPKALMAMCQALRGEGYRVLAACNCEQALDLFCYHMRDLDLALLGLEGAPDIVSRVHEIRPDMKFVCMPERHAHTTAIALPPTGRWTVLEKPFSSDRLMAVVRAVLNGRWARAAGAA